MYPLESSFDVKEKILIGTGIFIFGVFIIYIRCCRMK
jgi:hypothetical protein